MRKRATIRDVAEAAGVSTVTVSRVVNASELVQPETRARVERAMRELGYVPNLAAQAMRTNATRTIGFVVPDLTNYPNAAVAKATEAVLGADTECRLGATTLKVQVREEAFAGRVDEVERFGELVGASPAMRELYALLKAAAPTQATVLVTGESGTGKELVARTLHHESGRRGPLVVFDAGSADPSMMRAEMRLPLA